MNVNAKNKPVRFF